MYLFIYYCSFFKKIIVYIIYKYPIEEYDGILSGNPFLSRERER